MWNWHQTNEVVSGLAGPATNNSRNGKRVGQKKGPGALPAAGPVTDFPVSRCFSPEAGDEVRTPVVLVTPCEPQGHNRGVI